VAPKFAVFTRVGGYARGVIGVDFKEELAIKSFWSAAAGSLPKAPDALLAGSEAASRLGLAPGATVVVEGRTFSVAGVLAATGGEDDKVLFADLHALQQAVGKENRVHFVEVARCAPAAPSTRSPPRSRPSCRARTSRPCSRWSGSG